MRVAVERGQVVPLSVEQVEALAGAIDHRYRAMVTLAAGTGLRQGEALGLTVDRVDFLRRQVRVDRRLVTVKGSPPGFGPPKTAASVRTVPLPQVVADALAAHLSTFEPGPDGLIFTNEAGQPVRRTGFSERWRPAIAAAGLPTGTRSTSCATSTHPC